MVALIIVDLRGGGVGGVVAHSPSEVGTVTPPEGSIGALYEGVVGVIVIIWCLLGRILGVFDRVTRCCVHGSSHIWDGAVGVVDV